MPPVLGWAAVTGDVAPEALLLFLIIFVWTPPHFWSLALYRARGLRAAPGCRCCRSRTARATRSCMIVLYTVRAGRRVAAAVRDPDERHRSISSPRSRWAASFLGYAVRLYRRYSDALARATFRYSIVYLAALFSALLIDHYWRLTARRRARHCRRADAPRCFAALRRARARRRLRPRRPEVPGVRHHRRGVRPRFRADRPQRQAAHARRFSRQGRRACSSATRNVPTCVRRRSRRWRRR